MALLSGSGVHWVYRCHNWLIAELGSGQTGKSSSGRVQSPELPRTPAECTVAVLQREQGGQREWEEVWEEVTYVTPSGFYAFDASQASLIL